MLECLEKDVTPSVGLLTFHTTVVKLLWNWNGEDPEKLFWSRIHYHEKRLKQCKQTFPKSHDFGGYGQIQIKALVECYLNLGIVYYNKGINSEALQSYKRALSTATKSFGEEHESTADSYSQLGVTQNKMHDNSAALQSHQRALAIRIKLFGEDHESTADSYRELGVTQNKMHDNSAALQSLSLIHI